MKKLILIFITIFSYSLDIPSIDSIKHLISNKPKWVQKIDNGENIQKKGYHCWSVVRKNATKTEITNNIKKQIISEIFSIVNTSTTIKKSYSNQNINQSINTNLQIQSVGIISDVQPITRKYGKLLYGYYCMKNNDYEKLKEKNQKRRKQFLSLYKKFYKDINNNDIEAAKNILNIIEINLQEYTKTDIYKKIKNDINNKINVDIQIPNTIKQGESLNAKIFLNKNIYLNVININDNTLIISDKILIKNKINKIELIPNINYSDILKLKFIFTKIPLHLNTYITTNNRLQKNYNNYLINFKSEHFLYEITKEISIKKPPQICVYTNFKNSYINQILDDLNENIAQCDKTYKIKLKIKMRKYNNIINFQANIILFKNKNIIKKTPYQQRFTISQEDYMYNYYIIPEIERIIENIKNSL